MPDNNKPYRWVPTVYFMQGLPFALVSIVATILYKELNLNNATISVYISVFTLPWSLKPLWTPLLEIIATKRKWLLTMQYLLTIAVLLLVLALNSPHFLIYSALLFGCIALFSATNDAATDGFYLIHLDAQQQAYYIGIKSTFYQLARLFCSGLLVMFVGLCQRYYKATTSWQIGLASIALVLMCFARYHSKILPQKETLNPTNETTQSNKIFPVFFEVFKAFFTLPAIKTFLLFLLIYNAAEAQLLRIVPLFMLDKIASGGLGITTAQIGFIYGICGSCAVTAGTIMSGWLISVTSLKRSLIPITILTAIANSGYCLLSFFHIHNLWFVSCVIVFAQFCFGLATGAYMLFLIKICSRGKYKTTFYALGTAIMALGLMLFGAVSGYLQQLFTYQGFFFWIIIVSGLVLLYTIYTSKKIQLHSTTDYENQHI